MTQKKLTLKLNFIINIFANRTHKRITEKMWLGPIKKNSVMPKKVWYRPRGQQICEIFLVILKVLVTIDFIKQKQ